MLSAAVLSRKHVRTNIVSRTTRYGTVRLVRLVRYVRYDWYDWYGTYGTVRYNWYELKMNFRRGGRAFRRLRGHFHYQ